MADSVTSIIESSFSSLGGDTSGFSSEDTGGSDASESISESPDTTDTESATESVSAEAETPVTPVDTPVEPARQSDKLADPDADFLATPKDKFGKENRLPHSRVTTLVDKAVAKARAEFATESAAVNEKVTVYEDRLKGIEHIEKMMFEDQPRFLEVLKTLPGYASLLGNTRAQTAEPIDRVAAASAAAKNRPPPPDAKNADGSDGYSPDGLQALLDYTVNRAVEQAEARAAQKYGTLATERDNRIKRDALNKELDSKVSNQLERASRWPGWAENQAEILKVLQADTKMALTVEDAWRQVCIPKFQSNKAEMREQLLKELGAAPTSTSAGSGGSVARRAPSSGARTTEDVIRESMARLGNG